MFMLWRLLMWHRTTEFRRELATVVVACSGHACLRRAGLACAADLRILHKASIRPLGGDSLCGERRAQQLGGHGATQLVRTQEMEDDTLE